MLPKDFTERMKEMLGEEYSQFLESYNKPKFQALRRNPLKTTKEDFEEKNPFDLKPVPWAMHGYYYSGGEQPGKHPYHEAGVYYIQEPSAMSVVEYVEAKPGERILDLCAAPGGKTTQLAGFMEGEGLLVCNEIHPARAKILSENIERMGVVNALVTNETPQKLSQVFVDFFDKILVDAPCSGEGMFRKNEDACGEWSLANVQMCADRQAEILEEVAKMLKPGGRMVYSTCTFAPAENEDSMAQFLNRHPEFFIVPVERKDAMAAGNPNWASVSMEGLEHTIRLWPHHLDGEGHYIAVLEKRGSLPVDFKMKPRTGEEKAIKEKECQEFFEFQKAFLKVKTGNRPYLFGEQLYQMPEGMPSLKGLKVLRPGLHLGTLKKKRFEPSHALALALKPQEVVYTLDLKSDGNEIRQYLSGQTLSVQGEKGWYLITVDGYSIGWGKLAGGVMKNHYPKGLRK